MILRVKTGRNQYRAMKKRIFIRHKGFTIYVGTSRVSDEQIAAAKAELAAAASVSTSVEETPAATEPAEAEAEE